MSCRGLLICILHLLKRFTFLATHLSGSARNQGITILGQEKVKVQKTNRGDTAGHSRTLRSTADWILLKRKGKWHVQLYHEDFFCIRSASVSRRALDTRRGFLAHLHRYPQVLSLSCLLSESKPT